MKLSNLLKLKSILTKKETRNLIFLSLGTLVLSLSEALSLGVIVPIINLFVNESAVMSMPVVGWLFRVSGLKNTSVFLTALIITAIVLFLLKSVYSFFMLYQQNKFINCIYNRLTTKTLEIYLYRDYSFYLDSNSANLFKNISAEISQFTGGFLTAILTIGSELFVMTSIFVLLLVVYPLVTISLIIVILVFVITVSVFLKKRIEFYSAQRQSSCEQMYKTALEPLQAIKEILVYNRQLYFVNKFAKSVTKYSNSFLKFNTYSGMPRYLLEMIVFNSMLVILLFSTIYHKSLINIVPMLTVICLASLRLLPSINKIHSNINLYYFSVNSLDTVHQILYSDFNNFADAAANCTIPEISKNAKFLRLQNVTFTYSGAQTPIFKDLNLSIPLNRTIAFVGKTGAGKSTLIDIIMGLLVPSQGSLYFCDLPINHDNIQNYRKKIGYVPQNIFLTDDTIAENIAFGIPQKDIDYQELESVARKCQLEDFVRSLPSEFNTQVGERGVRISGGQKQRIGIARALYRNPEILVMDEATSSLDVHTESEICKAISQLSKKITVIIIAHRLDTIEHADIIYVLDNGEIAAQGNFKELLEKSAVFRKIMNQKDIFSR